MDFGAGIVTRDKFPLVCTKKPNAALHLRRGHRHGPPPPSPTPRRQVHALVELSALRGAPPRPTWLWPTRPAGHPLRPSTSAPDGVDGPGRTWYPTRVVGLAGGGRAHNALQNNSLAFSNTIGNILMRFLEMPSSWSLHYIKAHPGL